jgi:choline-glycine betaine transporter
MSAQYSLWTAVLLALIILIVVVGLIWWLNRNPANVIVIDNQEDINPPGVETLQTNRRLSHDLEMEAVPQQQQQQQQQQAKTLNRRELSHGTPIIINERMCRPMVKFQDGHCNNTRK